MKKLHITAIPLILLIFTLALSGCVDIKVTEKSGTTKVIDEDMNFTVTTETNKKPLPEPKDEELLFFDSLEEAFKSERVIKYDIIDFSDKSIIKLLQKDNDVVVFIAQNQNGNDYINTFKLRKKLKDNETLYSEPFNATGFAWEALECWLDGFEKRVEENEVLRYTVISELNMFNTMGHYDLGQTKEKVHWGCTADPNIKNLTINGQKPTEIIELKMDGDDVYFWYYENLQVDYDNIMEMEILY